MAEYRLYCLDREGRITRRHDMEAADDRAAIAAARAIASDVNCELWSGKKKIAFLPSGGGDPVFTAPNA